MPSLTGSGKISEYVSQCELSSRQEGKVSGGATGFGL